MATRDFVPRADGEGNIGTALKAWEKGYFKGLGLPNAGLSKFLEDVVVANDIDRNCIIRGQEITESWAALKTRIKAGDFSNLYPGDYKKITLTTNEVVIMEIAGIDPYYKCIDQQIGHHIDFISRDCLAGGKRMNATDTNNGNATVKNPWLASELYTTLNDESTGIYSKLPSDLKSHIITKRTLAEERYSAGGAVSANTSWSWQDMGKLWLPTEIEVFGCNIWSEAGWGSGQSIQYPIFKGSYKHILKGDGNGGSRCAWWEASARRASAANFCSVNNHGYAVLSAASYTGIRAPLCFRIG